MWETEITSLQLRRQELETWLSRKAPSISLGLLLDDYIYYVQYGDKICSPASCICFIHLDEKHLWANTVSYWAIMCHYEQGHLTSLILCRHSAGTKTKQNKIAISNILFIALLTCGLPEECARGGPPKAVFLKCKFCNALNLNSINDENKVENECPNWSMQNQSAEQFLLHLLIILSFKNI